MITFARINENGLEKEHELPSKREVCARCEGYGSHLHEAIGQHAYSREEFAESFDDEERGEYFRRGGRYDVTCEACQGRCVVDVVDEADAARTLRGRRLLALYAAVQEAAWDDAREREAERRWGY